MVIDVHGYRSNVGIILTDGNKRLFWGKRLGQNAWQFPQGGVMPKESIQDALFRELNEEVGLCPNDVKIIAESKGWVHYRLPARFIRHNIDPLCIGQKQRWFLLQLEASEDRIDFTQSATPEFEAWMWVSYWYPLRYVVSFKREVYRTVLKEFSEHIFCKQNRNAALDPLLQDLA